MEQSVWRIEDIVDWIQCCGRNKLTNALRFRWEQKLFLKIENIKIKKNEKEKGCGWVDSFGCFT